MADSMAKEYSDRCVTVYVGYLRGYLNKSTMLTHPQEIHREVPLYVDILCSVPTLTQTDTPFRELKGRVSELPAVYATITSVDISISAMGIRSTILRLSNNEGLLELAAAALAWPEIDTEPQTWAAKVRYTMIVEKGDQRHHPFYSALIGTRVMFDRFECGRYVLQAPIDQLPEDVRDALGV